MKKTILLILGLFLVSGLSYNFFFTTPVSQEMMKETPWYVNYDEAILSAEKKNILFFHAQWCPACRTLEKNLLKSTIPENIQFIKVNFDQSSELKKKYGVITQHTLVQVDQDGNMIKKVAGALSLEESLKKFQN